MRAGPHGRRVTLVIPHGVTEIGIEEDIGLVHVAIHALRSRDRAGEDVAQRMAFFLLPFLAIEVGFEIDALFAQMIFGLLDAAMGIFVCANALLLERILLAIFPARRLQLARDRRINRNRLTIAAIFRIDEAVARLAVIGIDHMARGAAGMAVIARLIIGAKEPGERIVQSRLVNIEHRDRHAQTCSGPAIGLLEIRATRLFQTLDLSRRIGNANFGELRVDRAPTALKHAEHISGRQHMPSGQRIHRRNRAALFLRIGHCARFSRRSGREDFCRLPVARIGLAQNVVLRRQDAVVVSRPAPQHRACRH